MERLLRQGLGALGLSDACVPALVRYAELLTERNRVMNLTAITAPEDIAALPFLDSAALLREVPLGGASVIDVGTGAGFPGLVLRIAEPSLRLTLLDALGKRVDFLRDVCADLGLTDVACVHGRAEEFAADHRETFDCAVSRAVAPLPVLAELCLPLVRVGGQFLAMKSVSSDEELSSARRAIGLLGGELVRTADYAIPGTEVRHRLIIIRKCRETPKKYPRIFAKIKKNPL